MKTIELYGAAKCVDLRPVNKFMPYAEWMWREKYRMKIRTLELCTFDESEQPFMRFSGYHENGDPFHLHTSSGIVKRDGNVIEYTTYNTKYVFELVTVS